MLRRWAQRLGVRFAVAAFVVSACVLALSRRYSGVHARTPTFEILLVGTNPSYAELSRTLDAILAVRSIAVLRPRVSVYAAANATGTALHTLATVRHTDDPDAAFLSYVSQRYATLPDFVLFAPAVPAAFDVFTRQLRAFDTAVQLLPLAARTGCVCGCGEVELQQKQLAARPRCVERFLSFRSGQFIVSKTVVQQHGAMFYEDVLQDYRSVQEKLHHAPGDSLPLSAALDIEVVWSRAFACGAEQQDDCAGTAQNLPRSSATAQEQSAQSKPLPRAHRKTIWLLWLSGWNDAPWLALRAADSWRLHNPTWSVMLLTESDLERHFSVPAYFSNAFISPQAKSDVIRLHVLAAHGGVWADATVLCTQPLDNWLHSMLEPAGFWMYHGTGWPPPKPASHANTAFPASWFMAAARGSYLARSWRSAADDYWAARTSGADDYFWMDALFRTLLRDDPLFKRQWSHVPYVSCEDNGQSHMFLGAVHKRIRSVDLAVLETNPPWVLKLSHHKLPRQEANFRWLSRRTAGFIAARITYVL